MTHSSGPTAGATTEPADVAELFLRHLSAMDIDAALGCFADDGVQEMPFAPDKFPHRLHGKDDLRRQYGGLPHAYQDMRFDVHAVRPATDGEWVTLEYRGLITQRDGSRYDNDYVGLFRVVDGRIVVYREYFNPIVLQQSFGDKLGGTFSVDAS